jgi:hypothetical protein
MLFKHCTRNVNFSACINEDVLEYSLQTLDQGRGDKKSNEEENKETKYYCFIFEF